MVGYGAVCSIVVVDSAGVGECGGLWVADDIDVEKVTWKSSGGGSLVIAGMEVKQSMPQGNAGHGS